MADKHFQLLLFSVEPEVIRPAVDAGVHGIVVDWEWKGKESRQLGADTQVNRNTDEDLKRVRSATTGTVICRVNGFPHLTGDEIEQAIEGGADEILLPMVRSVEEAQKVLNWIDGRCGMGILIETVRAVDIRRLLFKLPLSRVYVGLNDLAIERQTPNIFTALADGTVETIRRDCTHPFGIAGLTLPNKGIPIPCRLLISEMVRLRCHFSFLRRSFYRDVRGLDITKAVTELTTYLAEARTWPAATLAEARSELVDRIATWSVR